MATEALNGHRTSIRAVLGHPKAWATLATAAKAYGQVKAQIPGQKIHMAQMENIAVWDNTIFQTETVVCYKCPRLARQGVLRVGDMLNEGNLDLKNFDKMVPI